MPACTWQASQHQPGRQQHKRLCTTAVHAAQCSELRQHLCSCGCSAPTSTQCCYTELKNGACNWWRKPLQGAAAPAVQQKSSVWVTYGGCWTCVKAHPVQWCWSRQANGHSGGAGCCTARVCQTERWRHHSTASCGSRQPAHQPWAQQFAAALAAVGVHLDVATPRPISLAAVRSSSTQRQLVQLQTAATRRVPPS